MCEVSPDNATRGVYLVRIVAIALITQLPGAIAEVEAVAQDAGEGVGGASHTDRVQPSFNCELAQEKALQAICASNHLAELDLELSRLNALSLTGPDMSGDRINEVDEGRRKWAEDRRACRNSALGLEPCLARSYALRIHEMREDYAPARSDDAGGVSLGPFSIVCEGFAPAVRAVFINTPESLVSLKWGESAIVLPRTRSASGARYERKIGEAVLSIFWNKGNEAIFQPPAGVEMNCRVEQ